MAVSCVRNASRHNYRNSLVIVELMVMGPPIPRSTERISSSNRKLNTADNKCNIAIKRNALATQWPNFDLKSGGTKFEGAEDRDAERVEGGGEWGGGKSF